MFTNDSQRRDETPDEGPVLRVVSTPGAVTQYPRAPQYLSPLPGGRLTDVPHSAVAQLLSLADVRGGVQEEFVVSPLEDTSGVLGAGLGEEARSQEDGRVLRPLHQDLQS